jgi:hypothetical protein
VTASKQTSLIVAAAGLALAAVALVEGFAEVTPYFVGGISPAQRFGAIVSGEFTPADSKWSRDLFLNDCLDVPRSIFALAQPTARRKLLLENCRKHARAIVASVPTLSSAWLVVASASADLGDFGTMRSALAKSTRSAPGLQWLADRRSRLAEQYAPELEATGRADHQSDLRVLVAGAQGADVLAQRYARHSELRELILAAAETAPAGQQRHFFDRVQAHMSAEAFP